MVGTTSDETDKVISVGNKGFVQVNSENISEYGGIIATVVVLGVVFGVTGYASVRNWRQWGGSVPRQLAVMVGAAIMSFAVIVPVFLNRGNERFFIGNPDKDYPSLFDEKIWKKQMQNDKQRWIPYTVHSLLFVSGLIITMYGSRLEMLCREVNVQGSLRG